MRNAVEGVVNHSSKLTGELLIQVKLNKAAARLAAMLGPL
jgi:hypothetical protein